MSASSTADIVASRFIASLAGRDRCFVGHPVNPPYLAPVVEVCPSEWARPDVAERTCEV